jgi:dUTP pyrophosphatase
MNTDKNNSVKSPPNSPPPKRVKTDGTASTTSTMAHVNGSTVPVTTMDQAPPLLIKKLSDKARLPTRGSAFAAGYDVYASKATVIPARGKGLVDTDISMAVPAGTCKPGSSDTQRPARS